MPLVSRTFDQLIDFTRTSAATYVDASGRIVPTPASRNLLTFTQEFDNAVWAKANATIVANAAVAPDGTLTADKLAETAINGAFVMVQSPTMALNTMYSFSCYMKAAERSFGVLNIFTGTASCWTWYNLSTGTVSTLGAGATATITPAGNGWYRCTLTISTAASGSPNIAMWPSTANGVLTYTGTAGSGIFIWGAQLEAVPDANLVLGSELVTNGDFSGGTTTGWTAGGSATLSVSSGAMVVTNGATAFGYAYQGFTTVIGKTYRVTFDVTGGTGSGALYIGTTIGGFENYVTVHNSAAATYKAAFVATATTTYLRFGPATSTSGVTTSYDNISVKEITGTTGMPTDYTRNNGGVYPPRFDYDPVTLAPKGLLVEEQRTNLLLRSEEFDNAAWIKQHVAVSANSTTSPDGTADADKLVESSAASAKFTYGNAAIVNGTVYTGTFYAKAAERTWCYIHCDANDGTRGRFYVNLSTGAFGTIINEPISRSVTSVGNGWYRIQFTFTASSTTGAPLIGVTNADNTLSYTGDGTSGIFVWGAQLEAGSFATSYIPTVASQVTRTADVATITGANFSQWYNQSEGTLVVEATFLGRPQSIGNARTAVISDGTFNNLISAGLRNNAAYPGVYYGQVISGGVSQATLPSPLASDVGDNVTFRSAIAYKASDIAASGNGATPATSATGTIPTVNTLFIGSINGSANLTNGHIRSIRYYPTRLSNAQLQALTA